ncbi:MAG: SDR family oxidoreductase [Hoeflea sp.]|uniref:SDR family NAD(P)-dependent oxidoreductase n=1 Tax=Hoeflea sp. TaxID=1940281 RepID=UPI00329A4CA7|tara:strand:- start:1437 stop:2222 length:786 start_codon:yes stop_codon:yes gene_type:complete
MKTGKTAAVTGGASGIGEATVMRFAREGWNIVIGDINTSRGETVAEAARLAGAASVSVLHLDLADEASVTAFASETYARHASVDAVVNSGGILQNGIRFLDMPIEEFDTVWTINVRGTLLINQAFGRRMIDAGTGSIINMCSLTTYRPSPQPAYAPAKVALKSMTEIMAADLGPSGIRVNAVAPGYTLTPAMQARIDAGVRDPKAILDKSAIKRLVHPDDVAEAIHFLCSDAASAITGVVLPVDCGWLASSSYKSYASQPE